MPPVTVQRTVTGRETGFAAFEPPRWLSGGHLQTLYPFLRPAAPVAGPSRETVVPVAPGSAVRLEINTPSVKKWGTLLLVHGLGGCAESGYMRRSAVQALARGWLVVRMNCRNCGGTERLSRTLYNAGQSGDVEQVLLALESAGLPRPFAAIGFSLGGNLVLRYAGISGADTRLDAAAGLNPPIDLDLCSRTLEGPANRLYRWYFTRRLCRLIRQIRRVRPVAGPPANWWRIATVREFDRLFVAPDGGFRSAEEYYAKASAGPHLAAIRTPTLVLSAANDPFVPVEMFTAHHHANPALTFVHPPGGGHLGYWTRRRPAFMGASAALDFLEQALAGVRPAVGRS